jgi:hypothetical protein
MPGGQSWRSSHGGSGRPMTLVTTTGDPKDPAFHPLYLQEATRNPLPTHQPHTTTIHLLSIIPYSLIHLLHRLLYHHLLHRYHHHHHLLCTLLFLCNLSASIPLFQYMTFTTSSLLCPLFPRVDHMPQVEFAFQ